MNTTFKGTIFPHCLTHTKTPVDADSVVDLISNDSSQTLYRVIDCGL